jgi:hypothetical protein
VVAEGSVHETGLIYERVDAMPGVSGMVVDLPHLTRDDLARILAFNARDTAVNGPIYTPEGGLNFDATTVSPEMITAGPLSFEGLDGEGERNVTASRLAGKAIQQGASLAEVKAQLDAWNLSNENPLTVDELNQTIASVARTHTRKNPDKPISIVPAEPEALPIYHVFDLVEDERELPPYQIEGLWRQGDNVVIAGPPKSQKSFLLQDILIAMACGEPFLDFEVAREFKVVWIQAEMPWHESKRRLTENPRISERMAEGRPVEMFITDRFNTLAFDARGVDYIAKQIATRLEGEKPDIIAVDSLSAVWAEESENDNAQMQVFLRERIGKLREMFPDVTIVLVHHSAKMDKKAIKIDPFNAIRGASALRGWYTAGMVMHRTEDHLSPERQIHVELRGDVEPEPFSVQLGDDLTLHRFEKVEVDMPGLTAAARQKSVTDAFLKAESQKRVLNMYASSGDNYAGLALAMIMNPKTRSHTSKAFVAKIAEVRLVLDMLIENGTFDVRDLRTVIRKGPKQGLVRGPNFDLHVFGEVADETKEPEPEQADMVPGN